MAGCRMQAVNVDHDHWPRCAPLPGIRLTARLCALGHIAGMKLPKTAIAVPARQMRTPHYLAMGPGAPHFLTSDEPLGYVLLAVCLASSCPR